MLESCIKLRIKLKTVTGWCLKRHGPASVRKAENTNAQNLKVWEWRLEVKNTLHPLPAPCTAVLVQFRGAGLPCLEERASFSKNIYLSKGIILSKSITPGRTFVRYTSTTCILTNSVKTRKGICSSPKFQIINFIHVSPCAALDYWIFPLISYLGTSKNIGKYPRFSPKRGGLWKPVFKPPQP